MFKLVRRRYLIISLIGAFFLGWLIFSRGSGKKETLVLAEVKKQDIRETISTSGVLTGAHQATLKFKSGGKLSYLNIKAGDTVFAGQTIAGLDSPSLTIALQQAENTLRDKQANAQMVEDNVKNHDTDETFTQKQQRTTAQVARDNAYEGVRAAQQALSDAALTAPFAGLVTQADFLPGQTISSADIITEVVDFSELLFQADVDESDITKVSVGQSAEVALNAYGDKVFTGKVTEIIPQTKSTSNGATVVTVKIRLDDQSIRPIAGLNGQATLIIGEKKNVLAVPQEALRDDNTVFEQTAQGLKRIKVVPGLKSDLEVEIESGLSEGMKVIKNPPANFTRNQNFFTGILRRFTPGVRMNGSR